MKARLAKICQLLPFVLILALGSLPAFAEEFKKYNDKGNLIYSKDIDGNETWYSYHISGTVAMIHSRNKSGSEEWYSYDKKGRKIYYKNVFGDEIWYEYDENGNQYYKHKGDEYWTCSEPFEMVVLTDDGLPLCYRKSPVDGEKLGDFKNEVLVYATKRTAEKYEADGITDYWYLAHSGSEPEKQGWVFGGSIEFNGDRPTDPAL